MQLQLRAVAAAVGVSVVGEALAAAVGVSVVGEAAAGSLSTIFFPARGETLVTVELKVAGGVGDSTLNHSLLFPLSAKACTVL